MESEWERGRGISGQGTTVLKTSILCCLYDVPKADALFGILLGADAERKVESHEVAGDNVGIQYAIPG